MRAEESGGFAISVHGVRVGYGAREVLRGVTLEVERGSFLAVAGPNGSGKSTLVRTLARALAPSSGAVFLEGRALSDWRPKELAQRVAVVSQEGSPAFDFTAREVVGMGRAPYERRLSPDPKSPEAVERAMREVGVWELRERGVGTLSGGERQLVALARALAQEPEVLLLDEPTNHLDIRHQVEFMRALTRLNASGVTVLMVVHDLNLAARYALKVVLLSEGEVFAAGVPSVALSPENIQRVFGAEVESSISPRTGEVHIQPLGGAKPRRTAAPEVHVICGGGSGAALMRRLSEENVAFSAGVVNAGDTDHAVALSLGGSVVSGDSYSPISDEAHERNIAMAKAARLVVVCDMPFGAGNLKNLEATAEARRAGVSVLLLRDGLPEWAGERDYTGGEAGDLEGRLVEAGARVEGSVGAVISRFRDIPGDL